MMIALLWAQGTHTCARKHRLRHSDFRRGRRLGRHDHLIIWTRPQRPAWMDDVGELNVVDVLERGLPLVEDLFDYIRKRRDVQELADKLGTVSEVESTVDSVAPVARPTRRMPEVGEGAMSDQSERLTRQEFFDFLWEVPIAKLAQRWSIPSRDIVRLSEAYDVPRPPAGYWMQRKCGTKVIKPELPELADASDVELHQFRKEISASAATKGDPTASDESAGTLGSASPTAPANDDVVISDELTNPHAVVRRVRADFQASNSLRRQSDSQPKAYPVVRVSRAALPRALRILDAIYKSWEARGGQVRGSDGALGNGDDFVTMAIVEAIRRVQKKKTSGYFQEFEYVATGELTLEIHGRWIEYAQSRWSDGKTRKIESSLRNLLRRLPERLSQIRMRRLDDECIARQKNRLQTLAQRRKRDTELEQQRRDQLHQNADNWERAKRIKSYLAAIKAGLTSDVLTPGNPSNFAEWLEWAVHYADGLDPLTRSSRPDVHAALPQNSKLADLDVTQPTRHSLQRLEIVDTDALFAQSKVELEKVSGRASYHVLDELDRVMSLLGYDMTQRDWVWRFAK